jgi:hypothetical protein
LKPKKDYVVHALYAKLGLELGYKITPKYAIKFKQKRFLAKFVDTVYELRMEAKKNKDTVGDNTHKKTLNSSYGRWCQNPRKYGNWHKYLECTDGLLRAINHPRAKKVVKLDKIVLVEYAKPCIKYNRPIYVANAILDISKYIMADFWYNGIKKYYGDRIKLVYTDTDSLIVRIETKDPEKDFDSPELKDRFGSTPGKMKIESKLAYFKAYGPKHYEQITLDKKKDIKLKGIPIKKAEYNKDTGEYTFYSLRSIEHEVYRVKMVKSVKSEDDKRMRLDDGRIVAIGYKGIIPSDNDK